MNQLLPRVQIKDAALWLYTSLLMAGLLVAPAQAQTAESEIVPDSEAASAKIPIVCQIVQISEVYLVEIWEKLHLVRNLL